MFRDHIKHQATLYWLYVRYSPNPVQARVPYLPIPTVHPVPYSLVRDAITCFQGHRSRPVKPSLVIYHRIRYLQDLNQAHLWTCTTKGSVKVVIGPRQGTLPNTNIIYPTAVSLSASRPERNIAIPPTSVPILGYFTQYGSPQNYVHVTNGGHRRPSIRYSPLTGSSTYQHHSARTTVRVIYHSLRVHVL